MTKTAYKIAKKSVNFFEEIVWKMCQVKKKNKKKPNPLNPGKKISKKVIVSGFNDAGSARWSECVLRPGQEDGALIIGKKRYTQKNKYPALKNWQSESRASQAFGGNSFQKPLFFWGGGKFGWNLLKFAKYARSVQKNILFAVNFLILAKYNTICKDAQNAPKL